MTSILGLITLLGLFVVGQALINRLRGGSSHCGGCDDDGGHLRARPSGSCCGGSSSTREAS